MKKKFEFPEIDIVEFDMGRVLYEESGWDFFEDENDFGGVKPRPRS